MGQRQAPCNRIPFGAPVVMAGAFLAVVAAGCGMEPRDDTASGDGLEMKEGAVNVTWQNLALKPGWHPWQSSRPPAIGKANGVVMFKGALIADSGAGPIAFTLPVGFRPNPAASIGLRLAMAGQAGGALVINNLNFDATVAQDLVNPAGPGPEARLFTSLEGVSFDILVSDATPLAWASPWQGVYSYRDKTVGSYFKLVNGFIRFQGALTNATNSSQLLFNLPVGSRPGQGVYLPTTLCSGSSGAYGRLAVNPDGDGNVFVQAENLNQTAADCQTSLEGLSFSFSNTGTINLQLAHGWHAYSSRAVRVRNDQGVIRLEGAVAGGTQIQISTLPSGMRPSTNVYIAGDAIHATHARIVIDTSGVLSVDVPTLSVASGFLSLDGVFFGL